MIDATQYLPLVWKLARQYKSYLPNSVDVDDLFGDGCVGLVKASQVYDPSRGVPFHAYACRRIKGSMVDGLRRMDRLSRYTRRNNPFEVTSVPFTDTIRSPRNEARERQISLDAQVAAKAILELPARRQRIIRAYYWEQRNEREIGAELGIHESGVWMQQKKALAQLRAAMCRPKSETANFVVAP